METKTSETTLKAVRMKNSVVEAINEMAERENRNFSNMVNTMLMNVIRDDRKQNLEST